MNRLKYNSDFTKIIDDYPPYINKIENIKEKIKRYIKDIQDKRYIYDKKEDKYYCSTCLCELDNNYYCSKCNKNYDIDNLNYKYVINMKYTKKDKYISEYFHYYFFDFVNDEILLYLIEEKYCYGNNNKLSYPILTSSLDIGKVYLVRKNYLVDLMDNNFLVFKEIDKKREDNYGLLSGEFSIGYTKHSFIYKDNINKLKSTIYKYSNIWDGIHVLDDIDFNAEDLTFFPLYLKQFEYLIKYKLYKYAFDYPYLLEFKGNFKDTFGLEKSFLPFMQKYDLDSYEVDILKLIKIEDIDLIRSLKEQCGLLEFIHNEYKVNILKLVNYFNKNKYSYNNFDEYLDYLEMSRDLGLDMKSKRILFPKDFMKEHDRLYKQVVLSNDKEIDEKISKLSNLLKINSYEDDKYIIYPAPSVDSLIDESNQQDNCVRIYCDDYSNNISQIYFMREKKEPNKSLVTIEIKNNKIVQAKIRFNENPNKEEMNILKIWEEKLIPINNIND